MYTNILCAIDTSEENKNILNKAVRLAELHSAKLSLLHSVESSLLPKDYQKILMEEVNPVINKLAEDNNISKKRRFVKFGKPYDMTCDLAEQLNCDLIVVGSHGKYGWRALLGATANGVLQYAKCDVLLVRILK
jgi:universal stress protein A